MKFVTHNQNPRIDPTGTHLQDCINITYAEIKKVFGKPCAADGYKVDAEWDIEFEDGTIATVYNYKDGRNYNGRKGTATTKITDWHIGGTSKRAVELVKAALGVK